MNRTCLILLAAFAFAHPFPLAGQGSLSPSANFALRGSLIDATPDGSGFDGLLTTGSVMQEDRQYVEFNLSLLPVSWTSTGLRFVTAFSGAPFPPSTIGINSYPGNGIAEASDLSLPMTPQATIPGITSAGGQVFTVDVTSVIQSYRSAGFIGFQFQLIDPQLNQKILNAASIELVPIPEPSVGLLGSVGILLLVTRLRKTNS